MGKELEMLELRRALAGVVPLLSLALAGTPALAANSARTANGVSVSTVGLYQTVNRQHQPIGAPSTHFAVSVPAIYAYASYGRWAGRHTATFSWYPPNGKQYSSWSDHFTGTGSPTHDLYGIRIEGPAFAGHWTFALSIDGTVVKRVRFHIVGPKWKVQTAGPALAPPAGCCVLQHGGTADTLTDTAFHAVLTARSYRAGIVNAADEVADTGILWLWVHVTLHNTNATQFLHSTAANFHLTDAQGAIYSCVQAVGLPQYSHGRLLRERDVPAGGSNSGWIVFQLPAPAVGSTTYTLQWTPRTSSTSADSLLPVSTLNVISPA